MGKRGQLMNTIAPEKAAAREAARNENGTFGAQEHSSPEVTVGPSPKALGMIGLGPASENPLAEPFDSVEERPLRPYFALTPGDDDEFFDAPIGTTVHMVVKGKGGSRVRRFVKADDARFEQPVWHELAEFREVEIATHTAGELWEELFEDDGRMRSAMLCAPHGMLYSDRRGFVDRADIDKPITWEEARDFLAAFPKAHLVSRSRFGDSRDDGVPPAFHGKAHITVDEGGYLRITGPGRGRNAVRALHLSNVQVFDRDGDLVIRQELDPGFGWEEVLRPTR